MVTHFRNGGGDPPKPPFTHEKNIINNRKDFRQKGKVSKMTMTEKLKRAGDKVKKANHGRMRDLSTGEKVIKIVLILIKIALVATVGLFIGVFILAAVIAVGILNGMTDAVNDQITRSWNYHHRDRNW